MLVPFIKTLWTLHKARKEFPNASFEHGVVIKGQLSNFSLEGPVQIQAGTVIHLGGMAWCGNKGVVTIGAGSVISPNCVIYGAGSGGVRIGKNFDCGPGVGIFSSRTDYALGPNNHVFAPVVIGDNVIVFANCVIGPGVTIGDRAVIAAGSVVTRNIPPGVLAGGAPARILRKL